MLRSLTLLAATLVCLTLTACSPTPPPTSETIPPPLTAEAPDHALTPLEAETLTRTDNGKTTTLADYLSAADLTVKAYATLDLDQNGTAETVLHLSYLENDTYGYLVLYTDGDTTYAHEIPYRAMGELRADGTFSFSSGVSCHGVGRLTFAGSTVTTTATAECAGSPNGPIGYMVEEKSATQTEFDAYLDQQSQKPAAPWQTCPNA